MMDASSLLPLLCYRKPDRHWGFAEISAKTWRVEIGSDPRAQVPLYEPDADPTQVILQIIGPRWYVIETGRKNLLKVNGFNKRQGTIHANGAIFLKIGDTQMIFTAGGGKESEDDYTHTGTQAISLMAQPVPVDQVEFQPEKGQFGIVTMMGTEVFSLDTTVLIGSNPLCRVRTQGPDFMGVISRFRNRLYLHAPLEGQIFVDGEDSREPMMLRHNSVITTASDRMICKLSEEVKARPGFKQAPDLAGIRLCLLEVTRDGDVGKQYILPQAGRSVTIGRNPDCFIQVDREGISGRHAQILVKQAEIMIADNDSVNGTYINDRRVSRGSVHAGHFITFAGTTFLVCYSD